MRQQIPSQRTAPEPVRLPFSPLTHTELNDRHDAAALGAFYYLRACRIGDRLVLTPADHEALVGYIKTADDTLDASRVRCEAGAA